MIDVLIVDDHTIFRMGLKRLLSDEKDIQVADEARNGAIALSKLRQRLFDVVLLDISMDGRSGLEVLESIRTEYPALPVLVLSMYPEEQYALVAMKAGANGYLSKDVESDELIRAIRHISGGHRYLSQKGAETVMMQLDGRDERPIHQKLSAREYEVMKMIINGVSLTEIGEKMFISVKTVSTHRTRILEKLSVKSNAELVRYALKNGIVN